MLTKLGNKWLAGSWIKDGENYGQNLFQVDFDDCDNEVFTVIDGIVAFDKSMGLEVNNEGLEGLLENHKDEFRTEELEHLQNQLLPCLQDRAEPSQRPWRVNTAQKSASKAAMPCTRHGRFGSKLLCRVNTSWPLWKQISVPC